MMRRRLLLILLIVLAACASPPPTVEPTATFSPTATLIPTTVVIHKSLVGDWLGGLTQADGSIASFQLHFEDEANGTLTQQPTTQPWLLSEVVRDGNNVRFKATGTMEEAAGQAIFNGELTETSLIGELDWGGQLLALTFMPLANPDAASLGDYTGAYRFASGRVVSVLVSSNFESNGLRYFTPGLMLADYSNGDLRGLYPLSEGRWMIGAARAVGAPLGSLLTFTRDAGGAVTGLDWQAADSQVNEQATRVTLTFEEVNFTSADGTTLAGRFTLPGTPGPHPVLVMLHGSERGRRDNFGQRLLAHFLAAHGIALLTYDKRGVGDSGGTYRESAAEANLTLLAQDAAAGAAYLATRSDIRLESIGLIGGSQAGWVIPLAAAQSPEVDFFVIWSGPVVSVGVEDRYSTYTNDGESERPFDLDQIMRSLRTMSPTGFNPTPVLETLTQPGLWLWGEVDKSIPVALSAENLQRLIEAGQTNFSYTIFPKADHNLSQSQNGLLAEIPYARGLAPNYYPTLLAWLRQHIEGIGE